jgi:hypothetical protein
MRRKMMINISMEGATTRIMKENMDKHSKIMKIIWKKDG